MSCSEIPEGELELLYKELKFPCASWPLNTVYSFTICTIEVHTLMWSSRHTHVDSRKIRGWQQSVAPVGVVSSFQTWFGAAA